MENGVNGVTLPNSGVTINKQKNYATFNGTNLIRIDSANAYDNRLNGKSDKTLMCWFRSAEGNSVSRHNFLMGFFEHNGSSGPGIYLQNYSNYLNAATGWGACDCYAKNIENWFDGNWHFLVGIWSGGNKVELYYDGMKSAENNGTYNTVNSYLEIGGCSIAGGAYHIGDIGEIRVYGSKLTDDQINVIYNNGKSKYN